MTNLRLFGSLFLLAIGSLIAVAQAPPAPAAPGQLDAVLDTWERAMKGVSAFESTCKRTRTSKRFETTEICEGRIRILKGNDKTVYASLELNRNGAPAEKYVLNKRGVCEYDFGAKEIRIHPIALDANGSENPIGFIFEVKAKDLKDRFDLKLRAQDQFYSYIEVAPKPGANGAGFVKARLSLMQKTSMPAQLWFQQVNHDTTQWDLPHVNLKPVLAPADFDPVKPTADWREKATPRPGPTPTPTGLERRP